MALIRMTDKKIAASRANARLSKGPTSAAGKEKVSQNACKHHLYARKFFLPPAWAARIEDKVQPCVDTIEDPAERACLTQYLVLGLWKLELFAFSTRLLDQHIARKRSRCHGIREFTRNDSRCLAIGSRLLWLDRETEKARRDWKRSRKISSRKQSILQLIENQQLMPEQKTLILAAGAGSGAAAGPAGGAVASHSHASAPRSPYRKVRRTHPQTLSPHVIATTIHGYDHYSDATRRACPPGDTPRAAQVGSTRPASFLEPVRSQPPPPLDTSGETVAYAWLTHCGLGPVS